MPLTFDEQRCIDLTVELWNLFMRMPEYHSSDGLEMSRDIHDIQHRIKARVVKREEKA